MKAAQSGDPSGLEGLTLEGRFRVERLVAEGGFGVVYRGRQLALDRPVAIKVLKTAGGPDSFEAEARTIARLKHPHIIEVHDFGVSEGRLWMALEWLEGRTLERFLDGRGAMAPRDALELLRPVLQAIAFAHRQRVVHRDLKPANIFVADEGGTTTLKVLDFGIAKILAGEGET